MSERMQVEDLTLPRPAVQSADSSEHAAKRQERRRAILGDKAYEEEQSKLEQVGKTDASVGTPEDQVIADYERGNEFKDAVVERTAEKLDEAGETAHVEPPPFAHIETTETDATRAESSSESSASAHDELRD